MSESYRLTAEEADRLAVLRADCKACNGDAAICATGTPCPFDDPICFDEDCPGHRRLPGCIAWTADGQVAALPAPKQPWSIAISPSQGDEP